jgi:hypothetical protein
MEVTTKVVCVACQRTIDAGAKICPFCGANPVSGEKMDTQAILQEVFHGKELSASESVFEFARHRQGIVIGIGLVIVFLALTGLHQYVTARNAREVTDAPPVPLTELTDVSTPAGSERRVAMPELDFQYEGRPQTMRTFIVEQGAAAPPEIVAAQQAAQQAAAAKAAALQPSVQQPVPPAARPGFPARPAAVPPPGAARPGFPAATPAPARPVPPPAQPVRP